ncbi:hypothetical protein HMPREF9123_1634 [Neisseria bacilliformis ATCC BAA-1200]|uniref:Uncharacterized protein n=1 Tax=Neisseria bacilliformis ATCC BAA-1200 TaxID=888742 RepID=F2BD28_9NEIS|nr:hypothetical protein HMPREF9123_1634 [Neisseria bacilliformis ATCC BAA-1200]
MVQAVNSASLISGFLSGLCGGGFGFSDGLFLFTSGLRPSEKQLLFASG